MSRLEDPETVADSHLSTIVAMPVWKKPGAAQGSFQTQGVGGFTNHKQIRRKFGGHVMHGWSHWTRFGEKARIVLDWMGMLKNGASDKFRACLAFRVLAQCAYFRSRKAFQQSMVVTTTCQIFVPSQFENLFSFFCKGKFI
jgi:hypothetical protein